MTRCRIKCVGLIAGVVLLLVAVIGAGVVYSWTFTPHGRLDLLFAVGLRLAGSMPPPGTTPVEEERAAVRDVIRRAWGDPKPLPRVEDRRIPGPDSEIPVRIYWPSSADRQPILLFYHGGGFRLGDLDTYDPICRCFRHQLLLPRPYLVLTKPLRLDIQCQRGASVKIGWKYLDD